MPEIKREKKVRVVLYVPENIHSYISSSMERTIIAEGKPITFTKTQNEAYIDFIKRGIATLEDDQEPQ